MYINIHLKKLETNIDTPIKKCVKKCTCFLTNNKFIIILKISSLFEYDPFVTFLFFFYTIFESILLCVCTTMHKWMKWPVLPQEKEEEQESEKKEEN